MSAGRTMSLPNPPAFLDANAKREWRRVARALVSRKRWNPLKRSALTTYAHAYSTWSSMIPKARGKELITIGGKAKQNPFIIEANAAHEQMTVAAAELGLLDDATDESPDHGDTVNGTELAELFGVPLQRIEKYVVAGMPAHRTGRKGGANRYDADACLGWAVRTGKDTVIEKFLRGSARSTAMDLNVERAALARVQTEKAKREHAVAMLELIPRDEVTAGWVDLITNAKTRLLGIPIAVLGLCPDRADLADHVERLVYDAIDELAYTPRTPVVLESPAQRNGRGPGGVASAAAAATE